MRRICARGEGTVNRAPVAAQTCRARIPRWGQPCPARLCNQRDFTKPAPGPRDTPAGDSKAVQHVWMNRGTTGFMDKLIRRSSHSFLLQTRDERLRNRAPRASLARKAMGRNSLVRGVLIPLRTEGFRPGREARLPGDPRTMVCRLRPRPDPANLLRECPCSACDARAHAAACARAPLAPMGGAPGGSFRRRIAAVGPGGCCGSPGTTERRQGLPRACIA